MKRILLIITITVMAINTFAQDSKGYSKSNDEPIKTIFGKQKLSQGGYGALTVGYSQIEEKDALITGARLAWVIGHSFALGLGGSGFANDLYFKDHHGWHENSLEGGYGGLVLEPILFPKLPVHVSFPCLVGAGGVANGNSKHYDELDPDFYTKDSDAYFVVEPGVELEFNLIKCVRFALLASYRYTTGVHLPDTPHDVLNGYNLGMTLKFGKF